MGAWVTWALARPTTSCRPTAIPDPRGTPQSSVNNWGPGFLPAAFQGTDFNTNNPLRNLARPAGVSARTDRATRNFLQRLNQRHFEQFPGDTELAARISSYELAARMQLSVPGVSDLSTEKPPHSRRTGPMMLPIQSRPVLRKIAFSPDDSSRRACVSYSYSMGPTRPAAKGSATGMATRFCTSNMPNTALC